MAKFTLAAALVLCIFSAGTARSEDAIEDKIRKALTRKVSFEFVDTPLVDALDFIRHLTNVAIVVDPKALADGKDKAPINLRVADMDLDKALQWILKLAELEYKVQDQAIFVFPSAPPAPPAAARGKENEKQKEPPALEGVLRAKLSTGDAIEADAAMLRQNPKLEQEILSLAFDPAKDGILALAPGRDIPEGVQIRAFVNSAKKIAPDATFDFDDMLKLLLVRSKDTDDLRRINAIARALRRAAAERTAATARGAIAPRKKITAVIADRPIKDALRHIADVGRMELKILAADKETEAALEQPITLQAQDIEFTEFLSMISKLTALRLEMIDATTVRCAMTEAARQKPLAVKPPRPPEENERPKEPQKRANDAEPVF